LTKRGKVKQANEKEKGVPDTEEKKGGTAPPTAVMGESQSHN